MAYDIICKKCNEVTRANNIEVLTKHHINRLGHLVCKHCKSTDTYIYRESELQEDGGHWKRYIKLVIPINTGSQTYHPYIFLASSEKDSKLNQIHFNYYKDTRSSGGKLKHGHGPGGAPVFEKKELFQLLERLIKIGFVKSNELKSLLK